MLLGEIWRPLGRPADTGRPFRLRALRLLILNPELWRLFTFLYRHTKLRGFYALLADRLRLSENISGVPRLLAWCVKAVYCGRGWNLDLEFGGFGGIDSSHIMTSPMRVFRAKSPKPQILREGPGYHLSGTGCSGRAAGVRQRPVHAC